MFINVYFHKFNLVHFHCHLSVFNPRISIYEVGDLMV